MMSSRDKILQRLSECNTTPQPMPSLDFVRQQFDDLAATFRCNVERVGGTSISCDRSRPATRLLEELGVDGAVVSALPEFAMAQNPDNAASCKELGGSYTAIVRGAVGVAENGAVWIPLTMRHKAPLFAAEHLVVLLDAEAIVATMQDAMEDSRLGSPEFGCFIAGPSKTADIEQALVIGAHGAMRLTVVLQ